MCFNRRKKIKNSKIMAKNDFIFISDKMIQNMRNSGLGDSVYLYMGEFNNNHIHKLNKDIMPIQTEDVFDMVNTMTHNYEYDPWSEESIDFINKDMDPCVIAVCDMSECVNKKQCYLLDSIFIFLCAFIKAGGLVILNNTPIMDCKKFQAIKDERIKNQEYLTKINKK